MKFSPILLALAALLAFHATAQNVRSVDRTPIDVEVVDGRTVVREEIAITQSSETGLVWRMVTPGYIFPDDGIVIDSVGRHQCRPTKSGAEYRCSKLRHDPGERYKYIVNVVDVRSPQNAVNLEPLDPWIQNN